MAIDPGPWMATFEDGPLEGQGEQLPDLGEGPPPKHDFVPTLDGGRWIYRVRDWNAKRREVHYEYVGEKTS